MATTIASKTLRLGALEFPVALRAASGKKDVTFDRAVEVAPGEYQRIRRVDVDEEGNEVAPGAIARGVYTDEGFKAIAADAVQAIAALGEFEDGNDLRELAIEEFVPLKDVPMERAIGAYYIMPQKGGIGARPLRLLYEAMKAEKVAGVFKFVIKGGGRQKLAVLHPSDGRMLLSVLAFADEFVQADESREMLDSMEKPPKAQVDVARALIKAMKPEGEGVLATASDTAVAAKAKAFEECLGGSIPVAEVREATMPVATPDIMDALQRSLDDMAAAA